MNVRWYHKVLGFRSPVIPTTSVGTNTSYADFRLSEKIFPSIYPVGHMVWTRLSARSVSRFNPATLVCIVTNRVAVLSNLITQ